MGDFSKITMKIEKIPAHKQVYNGIKDAIINQQWIVGDKLPSESELAEIFGVNRLTVRMALQKLNVLGIVETRGGDGTYVREFNFNSYVSEVSEFYMRPELLDNVCDFRKLLEIECARLAIEKATEQELFELGELCRQYDELKRNADKDFNSETLSDLAQIDLEFHYKICKMSHNELYAYAFSVARESIYQYLLLILNKRLEGFKKKHISIIEGDFLHRTIYHAIVNKDFEACKKAYLDMVDHNVDL